MSRPAFTLLELLLVATLLCVAAAVTVPAVTGVAKRRELMTATGDTLRFLDENRRRAVEEGAARWVRVESGGPNLIAGVVAAGIDHDVSLPDGCEFEDFDPAERLSEVVKDSAKREFVEASWSPEATFFPDGTSTDLAFTVEGPGGRRRNLNLRGLTGRASLVRPEE